MEMQLASHQQQAIQAKYQNKEQQLQLLEEARVHVQVHHSFLCQLKKFSGRIGHRAASRQRSNQT